MAEMETISVCYVLSYYSPRYVRTETLVKALQKIKNLELHQARNSSKGLWRYFETIWKLIGIRLLHNPQYYILGFRGYEIFWIVRLITTGRSLIYDHMMSPYDSLVNEKKTIRKEGLLGRAIYLYERSILLASDVVLTDTNIHKQYFHELFDTPLDKIEAVPVGTDEDVFRLKISANTPISSGIFEVLFYGSFLPLHGMDVVLKAASILREKPIHFTLIGGNRLDLSEFHHMIEQLELKNVTHIDWVEYEELPRYIARADLGLGGPFGDTGQAGRVITGKTFQFLAMAKPVLVGYHDGDDGFEDRVNCLQVPRGDEKALANAVAWALEHRERLKWIGKSGYELYRLRYSVLQISEKLKGVISV
jgi:glycosyltransferase involved in cell wall biosynthesis